MGTSPCHWLVSVSAHRYLECLGTRLELDAQPKWANAVCMHEHARLNTSMAIPSEDIRFVLWPIIDRKELECDLSSTTWSCVHIYNAHAAKHSRLIPRLLAVFSAAFGRERSHPLLVEASSFSSSSSESSSSSSYSSSRLARHVRQHSDPEDRQQWCLLEAYSLVVQRSVGSSFWPWRNTPLATTSSLVLGILASV